MTEEKHEKDIHRYSYSRLSSFKECPRKHHYQYVEQIPEPENEYALSGKLFHQCVETILNGEDPEPVYKEWNKYIDRGVLTLDRDQLEYSVNMYFSYYYHNYKIENTIFVEQDFNYQLEDDDYMVGKVDQAYEIDGLLGVRDIKTTRSPLKYTYDVVRTNQQLLTYVKPVEEMLGRKVDFVEIDEIRLAKLADSVPLTQKGKPSTSLEALSLVTADLYRECLEELELINDPKFKVVLQLLEQRGHPLFNRIKVQLTNRNLLDTNDEELNDLYIGASMDIKYRNREQKRCFMCPYHSLCDHDEQGGSSLLREEIIKNFS